MPARQVCTVLVLLAAPVLGEPRLVVETVPLPATALYLREHDGQAWRLATDRTPASLPLADGSYDVRVEADDGLFYQYQGVASAVRPGYDHPVIRMHSHLYYPTAVPTAAVLAAALLLLAWRAWKARPIKARPARIRVEPAVVERVLPSLTGCTLAIETGQQFYIHGELGRGEMGLVYEASSLTGEVQTYALKILRRVNSDRNWQRFEREVRLCAQLKHPNIVNLLGTGTYQGPDGYRWPFMVMEKLEGETLRQRLERGRPPLADAVWWAMEMLRALQAAHDARVVHRDLKPENVMLTLQGGLKVMDFGVAFQLGDNDLTRTGQALGTPVYMSPEHLDAKSATAASDVYSVGVILYEALSGAYPHEASEAWGLLARKLTEPPIHLLRRLPDLDRELCRIVMGMLVTNPAKRYHSAEAVLADLEPWATGAGVFR